MLADPLDLVGVPLALRRRAGVLEPDLVEVVDRPGLLRLTGVPVVDLDLLSTVDRHPGLRVARGADGAAATRRSLAQRCPRIREPGEDAAVRAAEQALCEPGQGDVLIFMPGERDIRETCDLLEGRFGREAEIIPLFGLLSAADQQRGIVRMILQAAIELLSRERAIVAFHPGDVGGERWISCALRGFDRLLRRPRARDR